jgi:hypothetical protein
MISGNREERKGASTKRDVLVKKVIPEGKKCRY